MHFLMGFSFSNWLMSHVHVICKKSFWGVNQERDRIKGISDISISVGRFYNRKKEKIIKTKRGYMTISFSVLFTLKLPCVAVCNINGMKQTKIMKQSSLVDMYNMGRNSQFMI